jgi:hypothetical protein
MSCCSASPLCTAQRGYARRRGTHRGAETEGSRMEAPRTRLPLMRVALLPEARAERRAGNTVENGFYVYGLRTEARLSRPDHAPYVRDAQSGGAGTRASRGSGAWRGGPHARVRRGEAPAPLAASLDVRESYFGLCGAEDRGSVPWGNRDRGSAGMATAFLGRMLRRPSKPVLRRSASGWIGTG